MNRCKAKIWSDPLIQCIRREGHDEWHEAVDVESRATYGSEASVTYRWPSDTEEWWDVG